MPPPNIFRYFIALLKSFSEQSKRDPTGQPNPLLKQTEIVSKSSPKREKSIPFLTEAFQILAPSK